MDVQKSFVNTDGIAVIKCPSCSKIKNLQADKFRGKQHTLKVRCSCGHAWSLLLDFRRHYRKETELTGTYVLESPAIGGGRLTVMNISRSGVGFTVTGLHTIKIGQKARLQFTLDNKKRTPIDKRVTVRAVLGNYVGCEFLEERAFEKDLGFYLQP
jgi:PilZ domain